MSTDVLGYLHSKSLNPKRASGYEVNVACFFCGEPEGKRGRLYINTDPDAEIPGLFECKICGVHGAFPTIQRHFGDKPENNQKDDDWLERREILAEAAAFYHGELAEHPEVLRWLKGPERGLTLETIQDQQIGYANGGLIGHLKDKGYRMADALKTGLVVDYSSRLQDSFREMVTIPYFTTGNVTMIRGRKWPFDGDGAKYKTPGGQATRLFNSDGCWETNELIVTEGEFDALTLKQLGFKNVVGCPGAGVWQESWDSYVDTMKRVYVVFDNDTAGMKGLEKLKERPWAAKIRPVLLSDGEKMDPTEWVSRGGDAEAFQRLLMRSSSSGGLLVTVDEAYEEHNSVQGLEGLKFGVPKLDTTIAPGLLPAQVLVVLAKAGTGKTLFLLNMFQRMAMHPEQQDLKVLFVSLEQTRGDWYERARRIWQFYNPHSDDEECRDFWRDRLMIVDKNRVTEEELISVLDDFEDRMGALPDLMALDYLGYFAQSYRGDRYERVSDAVMGLKAVGKDKRIPIITPHQVSRVAKYGEEPDTDAARDAGVVEETADFLFTMWSPDAQLGRSEKDKSGVVSLRVGKSRHGGRGVKVDFQFAPLTLALVPDGDQLQKRALMELDMEKENKPWGEAVFQHRTGIAGALRSPAAAAAPAMELDLPTPRLDRRDIS